MPLPDASQERLALAYYYVWFTKGWFDGSDTPNLKAAMSDIHPTVGPYDSHDPDVIHEHMHQCRKAHLDALAVSWFYEKRNIGPGGAHTGASNDDILEQVMTAAANHGMRCCIDMEAGGLSAERLHAAFRHYLKKYTDDPRALHAEGKPVVLCWSTWKLGAPAWTEIAAALRKEGLDAFFVASNQMDPTYLSFLDALECYTPLSTTETVMAQYTRIRSEVEAFKAAYAGAKKRWHATIMPGFDDRCIPGRLVRDDYMHYRLRRHGYYYWETFAAAMASRPEWLHVTSFNELAEHSQIEETLEDGDLYLRLTAEMIDHYKAAKF